MTEWQGADDNNVHCWLEWTGWTGSGFCLHELPSFLPLPPYLPLLDHTWWQVCCKWLKSICHILIVVWCGIILCLSTWKPLHWDTKSITWLNVHWIICSWLLAHNATTKVKNSNALSLRFLLVLTLPSALFQVWGLSLENMNKVYNESLHGSLAFQGPAVL